MKWNRVDEILPQEDGIDHDYLISDGKNIGLGYFENGTGWHDYTRLLDHILCILPVVTHWAFLPDLPEK